MRLRPSRRLLLLLGALTVLQALAVAFGTGATWVLAAAFALVVVAVADWGFGRPRPLRLRRELPQRWPLGADVEARLTLQQAEGADRAAAATVHEAWPAELEVADGAEGVVPARGEFTLAVPVRPLHHGVLAWSEVRVVQPSALGLWQGVQVEDLPARVEVLPPFALEGEALAEARRLGDPGTRRTRRRGEGSEFESLREYRPGDEPTRIDWKASARAGRVVSRQYTVEKDRDVMLALDCGRLMGAHFDGIAKFDRVLSAALTLAQQGLATGDRVGCMGFDAEVRAFVPPGKGTGQMATLLDAAVGLTSRPVETDFVRALSLLDRRHRKRSLIVVFTDFVDLAAAGPMMDVLAALARRHAILFVAVTDPTLEDLLSEEAEDTAELAARAAAFALRRERRVVLRQLQRLGLEVLDLPPDRLTGPVLNAYLRMRESGVV